MLDREHLQSIIRKSTFLDIELLEENFDSFTKNCVDIKIEGGKFMSLCFSKYELLDVVCGGDILFLLTRAYMENIAAIKYAVYREANVVPAEDEGQVDEN